MRKNSEDTDSSLPSDEVFGGINLLTKSLSDLDDRGLVLSLAAFAEEALGNLLKAFLIPSDATSKLIDGFNAPLGTFSSRTKAAYAMGLITSDQFLDLERLRKVRNEFAHSWKPIDTSQPKIAALIDGMNFSRIDDQFPLKANAKIRSSMSCLLIELRSSTHQVQKKNRSATLIGNHLMPGFFGNFDSQIQQARTDLRNIEKGLETAEGRHRDFFLARLTQFEARLTVLMRPKTPDHKKTLVDLYEEFRKILDGISAT